MIPEAAVEAAAATLCGVTPEAWESQATHTKDTYRWEAIAALEAAAPHMGRVLVSAEQLNTLPAGSVVMGFDDDNDQLVSRKSSNGLWEQAGTDDGWQAAGIIQWHGSVTVLYEPSP